MTGREKIHAALSGGGTEEIPVVICYESIFYRDHWQEVTSCPWWYSAEADVNRQVMWREEAYPQVAQDWFHLPKGYPRESRKDISIVCGRGKAIRHNERTGEKEVIPKPEIGGAAVHEWNRRRASTREDIDNIVALVDSAGQIKTDGSRDLAEALLGGVCAGLCPGTHISSPLYSCVLLWGFEGFMLKLVDDPRLVEYACERYCKRNRGLLAEAAALGAETVWIEECHIDMISPAMFERFNLPYVIRLVDDIRSSGMKSVYYHCGNPAGKLELLLRACPDAVAFEESKKGFVIDIGDIVEAVNGRCAVFGNLDAIWLLPFCTETELKCEITRQIAAGRKNKGRFVMSIGSPVTPGTTAARVRRYCDMARELGRL